MDKNLVTPVNIGIFTVTAADKKPTSGFPWESFAQSWQVAEMETCPRIFLQLRKILAALLGGLSSLSLHRGWDLTGEIFRTARRWKRPACLARCNVLRERKKQSSLTRSVLPRWYGDDSFSRTDKFMAGRSARSNSPSSPSVLMRSFSSMISTLAAFSFT